MYDIVADLLSLPAGADQSVVAVTGALAVLLVVWFLDTLMKLFRI